MLELTMRDVMLAAKPAFENGELQAQKWLEANKKTRSFAPDPCYSGPCAIGVAMTPEVASGLDAKHGGCALYALAYAKEISFPNAKELADAIRLQDYHDALIIHMGSKEKRLKLAKLERAIKRFYKKYVGDDAQTQA